MSNLDQVKTVFEEERNYCKLIHDKQKKLEEAINKAIFPTLIHPTEWDDLSIRFPDQKMVVDEDEELFGDPVVLYISFQKLSPPDFDDIESDNDIDIFDKLTMYFETNNVWISYQMDCISGCVPTQREKRLDLQPCNSIEAYVKQAIDQTHEWDKERIKTRTRVALWRENHRDEEKY